jgi:RNA recognition motif-containing protein
MASSKLYVGNLAYSTTDEGLESAFSQHGKVESASVVTDRDSGMSRGFGFVTMCSPEEAEVARTAMNGVELDGRMLKVDEAKERPERGGGAGHRGTGGGSGAGSGGYGGGGRW